MRARRLKLAAWVAAAFLSTASTAVAQPYLINSFPGYTPASWTPNGSVSVTASGLNNGSLVTTVASPTTNDYEARMTLRLTQSGGSFSTLVRASQDAIFPGRGTFYAVEVANVAVVNGVCTTGVVLWKSVAGQLSVLSIVNIACKDGMVLRTVVRGNWIFVLRDELEAQVLFYVDSSSPITTGRPGLAVHSAPAGNGITGVTLLAGDTAPPSMIEVPGVTTFGNRVEMQWAGSNDGANGSGVYLYYITRQDGGQGAYNYIATVRRPYFADVSVQPSSNYSYAIYTIDVHQNWSLPQVLSVTTQAVGVRDVRQIGIRPEGSYWGGGGEQIDMQSGNLNYTFPLFQAKSRRGPSVGVSLNYNAQNWRRDGTQVWHYGRDVGFGYGWRLLAGSITPVYSSAYFCVLYIFTDSTGAEYRLERSTPDPVDGNYKLWTAADGFFGTYEERTRRLWFNDGSFWQMDSESYETEEDAGTRYPTLFQDSNGNQIVFEYQNGLLSPYPNSSSRIARIYDVRSLPTQASHTFYYNASNHLYQISMPTGEGYVQFQHSPARTVVSPWGAGAYGTTQTLTQITRPENVIYTFDFGAVSTPTTGELGSVTLPYGGRIRWSMRDFTYAGNRTTREVTARLLRKGAGANDPETYHWIWRDDPGDAARSYHVAGIMVQADEPPYSDKAWWFDSSGRATILQERGKNSAGHVVAVRQTDYTWSYANPATQAHPYISRAQTTQYGTGGNLVSASEQQLDIYGNVAWSKQISGASERTTTLTYLHQTNPAYAARYIRNRLTSVTTTGGGQTFNLLSATYDGRPFVYTAPWTQPAPPGMPPPENMAAPAQLHLYDESYTSVTLRGNPTRVTQGTAISDVTAIWYTGVPQTMTGPDGTVTTLPAAAGKTGVPAAMAVNGITSWVSWDGAGRINASVGPSGEKATFGWDSASRPTSKQNPDGSWTRYFYSMSPAKTIEQTLNRYVEHELDGLGRPVKTITGWGGKPIPGTYPEQFTARTPETVTETVYGPCACGPFGKVLRQSVPRQYGSGSVLWNVTTYDSLGRTVSIKHAATGTDGSGNAGETTYVYDVESGLATTRVNPPVNPGNAVTWKKSGTDGFGDLKRVWEPKPGGGEYISDYTYNALGKLTGVTMTRDGRKNNAASSYTQTRTWNYSSDGTLASTVFPENGTTTYTYSNGKIATRRDSRNRETRYIYTTGRLTQVQYWNGSVEDVGARATYEYDSVGRLSVANHGGVSEQMTYTPAGQLSSKLLRHPYETANVPGWMPIQVSLGYDTEGKLQGITYPGGKTYTYKYDQKDRQVELQDQSVYVVNGGATVPCAAATASYGWRGEMAAMQQNLCSSDPFEQTPQWNQSWGYNALGQMSTYTHQFQYGAMTSVTYNYGTVAAAGKLTSATTNGVATSYAYDALGRLTSATAAGWSQSFTYDGFGTLYQKTATGAAAYVGTANWSAILDSEKNQIGAHDATGNMTLVNGAYDYENRLTQYQGEQYSYGMGNKRVLRWKNVAGDITADATLWVGSMKIGTYGTTWNSGTQQWTFSGASHQQYIGGRKVSPQDRLGSNITGGRILLPYGEEVNPTANGYDKFATYHRDETGLDYADQRFYQPGQGRFLTSDPYEASGGPVNPGSWNRYAYVEGDPVNFVDPQGLVACGSGFRMKGDTIIVDVYECIGYLPLSAPTASAMDQRAEGPPPGEPMVNGPCPGVPSPPSDPKLVNARETLDRNMHLAATRWGTMIYSPMEMNAGTVALHALWFYDQVKNHGDWDFKQIDKNRPAGTKSAYEDYGNFHYGAVGQAAGFTLDQLLRLAGWAQQRAGTAEEGDPGTLLEILFGIGGTPPYGDNATDQAMIRAGFMYGWSRSRGCWP